jgi:uncharacterized protein YkwD
MARRLIPFFILALALALVPGPARPGEPVRVRGYLSPTTPGKTPDKLVFIFRDRDGTERTLLYRGRFVRDRKNARVLNFGGFAEELTPPQPPPAPPPTPEPSEAAAALLAAANRARAAAGLSALQDEPRLDRAAQGWAEFCARAGTLSHFGPAGTTDADPWTRARAAGFPATYQNLNENAAAGQRSAAEAMQDWLQSPGHRANLLNPKWTNVGGGMATGADGTMYWVQDFASE